MDPNRPYRDDDETEPLIPLSPEKDDESAPLLPASVAADNEESIYAEAQEDDEFTPPSKSGRFSRVINRFRQFKWTRKRAIIALMIIAILITSITLSAVFITRAVIKARRRHSSWRYTPPDPRMGCSNFVHFTPYPNPNFTEVNYGQHFIGGTNNFRQFANATMTIPGAADLTFKGRGTNGVIEFVNDLPVDADITLDISVWFNADHDVDVCEFTQGFPRGYSRGVGIFGPRHSYLYSPPGIYHSTARLYSYYRLKVHLPTADRSHTPVDPQWSDYRMLRVDMPSFDLQFGDLNDAITFNIVDISSGSASINAEALKAKSISMTTTNGDIRGSYTAEDMLSVSTSNGVVDFNATVISRGRSRQPSRVVMWNSLNYNKTSTNGRLSLVSSAPDDTGGAFDVTIVSESPVKLLVDEMPLNAHFHLSASAAYSPITVEVPETYEGAFALNSGWNVVSSDQNATDPAGKGRNRILDVRGDQRNTMTGETWWGAKRDDRADNSISLTTALAGARLIL